MANAITQVVASKAINSLSLICLPPSADLDTASSGCNGGCSDKPNSLHFQRRIFAWGLAGGVLGLNVGDECALAAKRTAPAPTEEKRDPNVSGVQAKVLASKRRKEAMKEAMAKQREKGKAIDK